MLFRLTYSITPWRDPPSNPIHFTYGGTEPVRVSLFRPENPKDGAFTWPEDSVHCTAEKRIAPPAEIEAAFVSISENRLPEGTVVKKEAWYLEADGTLKPNYAIPLSHFPPWFRRFVNELHKELRDYLVSTIRVLRWRCLVEGRPNPFAHVRFEWSFDGLKWRYVPTSTSLHVELQRNVHFSPKALAEIEKLVSEGRSEPLGHELLREAQHLRSSTPRSSLLTAVAAAEVGFKECVADLVPQAKWLILKVPSPPLTKMLKEYLPNLAGRRLIKGLVSPPPKHVMRVLHEAVEKRNEVIHQGAASLTSDDLVVVLDAVSDLLFLLDYYRGQEWALENITLDTLDELGLAVEGIPNHCGVVRSQGSVED